MLALVGVRRHLVGPSPADAGEPQLSHQALDGAAGDADALPVELGPDLVGAVDVEVLGPCTRAISRLQLLVAHWPVLTVVASSPPSRCSGRSCSRAR